MRRVVRGLGLYDVSALVDSGNMLSLATGWSVGVFDRDKIAGDLIRLGVGREGEEYEGIGRGPLNIKGLPVLRDEIGGFGTPTSDHERTRTEQDTCHISVTLHVFDSAGEDLEAIERMMRDIFTRHCAARKRQRYQAVVYQYAHVFFRFAQFEFPDHGVRAFLYSVIGHTISPYFT